MSWLFLLITAVLDLFNPMCGPILAMFPLIFMFIFFGFEINIWVRVSDYRTPRHISGNGKRADRKRELYKTQVALIPKTVRTLGRGMRMLAIMHAVVQIIFGGLLALSVLLSVALGENIRSLSVINIPESRRGIVSFILYVLAAICSICTIVAVWKRTIAYNNMVQES